MKMFGLALAAMVATTGLLPAAATTAAEAQRVVVHERTVVHRGPAVRRYRYRTRRVCTVRYHHHRRVRTCRNVRYRY